MRKPVLTRAAITLPTEDVVETLETKMRMQEHRMCFIAGAEASVEPRRHLLAR